MHDAFFDGGVKKSGWKWEQGAEIPRVLRLYWLGRASDEKMG